MREAVIVASSRTPLAKSFRGSFNLTRPDDLAAHCIADVLRKVPQLDPTEIEDVILGCAVPEGQQGDNVARVAALRAGLPVTTAGLTVNRFCSSGLQAIALAARRVIAGEGSIYAAGGVESISCVQNEANRHMIVEGWLKQNKPEIYWNMLQTAENVAKRYNIPR